MDFAIQKEGLNTLDKINASTKNERRGMNNCPDDYYAFWMIMDNASDNAK